MVAAKFGLAWRTNRPWAAIDEGVVYIDDAGVPTVATLGDLARMRIPSQARDFCVSRDQSVMAILTEDQSTYPPVPSVWLSPSRGEPFKHVGDIAIEFANLVPADRRPVWLIQDGIERNLVVDCEAGVVDTIATSDEFIEPIYWSKDLHVVRAGPVSTVGRLDAKPHKCRSRAGYGQPWTPLPSCEVPPPGDNVFALNEQEEENGEEEQDGEPRAVDALAPQLEFARFYSPAGIVVPGEVAGLQRVNEQGEIKDAIPFAGGDSLECRPALPTTPLFHCLGGNEEVLVHVGSAGDAKVELRRQLSGTMALVLRELRTLKTSSWLYSLDEGVAVTGRCSDALTRNVQCVRQPDGAWRDVDCGPVGRRADELKERFLGTTPTPRGGLVFATSRKDPSSSLPVVSVWDAETGTAHQLPAGTRVDDASWRTQWSWTADQTRRAWPVIRSKAAPGRPAQLCTAEESGAGGHTERCLTGEFFLVGAYGLWRNASGELQETVDAGAHWTPVVLPKGAEKEHVRCYAIGCRIGPYWRHGWTNAGR
jgi:hypothetical protein